MAYIKVNTSLPRSLDVQISLSKAQAETRTDLTMSCIVGDSLGFLPDANRIRFYSSIAAVEVDFNNTTEVYKAASAFFAQSPRPVTMAIAEAYSAALKAQLVAGALTADDIASIIAIDDGNLKVTVGGVAYDLNALDFTDATTLEGIAAIIDDALDTAVAGATCAVVTYPGGSKRIVISSNASGDGATIAFPITTGVGTYIGVLAKLTAAPGGKVLQGYTPTGIAGELSEIASAANVNGKYIYGWCLTSDFRDVETQVAAAEWVLPRVGIMPLVTNDVTALDPTYEDDLGTILKAAGNKRAVPIYHDNPSRYPDVSILAYMLHVNYKLEDSTVTAKFKKLPGIETVQLSESQWAALQAKGYNTYTAIGNSARTYRDGNTEDATWYMDSVINFDNLTEDLSVNVYNVFLRNKKVPGNGRGQLLLVDACKDTGRQYIYNGTLSDREVADETTKSGTSLLKAVEIIPARIADQTAADRAARIAPPIQMVVQEAGAFHSVAINVEVVS